MKNLHSFDPPKTLTSFLEDILASKPFRLRAEVAKEVLDYHDPSAFFTDWQSDCL